jgi:tetratricopeptide (TPR) repeat protein
MDASDNPIYSTAAVKLERIPEFEITRNTIQNVSGNRETDPGGGNNQQAFYGEGIELINAGTGAVYRRVVRENNISRCVTGFRAYGAAASVVDNAISDNQYGARLFNNSNICFSGNADWNSGKKQIIADNSSYELYISNNSQITNFRSNRIMDEDNRGNSHSTPDPLIYYDCHGSENLTNIDATCNYWGVNFNPMEDLYPQHSYSYLPIWGPGSPILVCTASIVQSAYESGMDYFGEGNYSAAKEIFHDLIEQYPESGYARAALSELYAVEQFLDNDYEALRSYLQETEYIRADSSLSVTADFLTARCDVRLTDWQPPIDWYEKRIMNPPSFQDSIFAVIDLGNIYLMMEEEDSDSLKSNRAIFNRLPQLVPESRLQYEQNRDDLLALLPKQETADNNFILHESSVGVIHEIYPNPTQNAANIVYSLLERSSVNIVIYNQWGQICETSPQGGKDAGDYRLEVSLQGMPSGIYHCVLSVDGKKADSKKLIIK